MRDVGKHFTVNAMLAKESVKRRIESEDGISYTEFSYSLLQAYDFLVLHDRFGCTLQMGGSDQWGNITAGMDLIRRVRGGKAHGLVMPLVTTAAGTKFGKTEAGSDLARSAADVAVRVLSVLAEHRRSRRGEVSQVLHLPRRRRGSPSSRRRRRSEPEKRHAQRALAREVTRLVHGEAAVRDAEAAAEKLFGGDVAAMSVRELLQVFANVPSHDGATWPTAGRSSELLADDGRDAVERRGDAADQRRRHLRERPARHGREGAADGRTRRSRASCSWCARERSDNFLVRIGRMPDRGRLTGAGDVRRIQ